MGPGECAVCEIGEEQVSCLTRWRLAPSGSPPPWDAAALKGIQLKSAPKIGEAVVLIIWWLACWRCVNGSFRGVSASERVLIM